MSKKHNNKKPIGSKNPSVIEIPIKITNRVRSSLYENNRIGVGWPFHFDKKNNELSFVNFKKTNSTMEKLDFDEFVEKVNFINFKKNQKVADLKDTDIPVILKKVGKQTSQGKVFESSINIDHNEIFMVVKLDILKKKGFQLWITESKKTFLNGETRVYQVISDAYMDALCSILLSGIVEQKISPHFPLCYGTLVSGIRMKSNAKDKGGSFNQSIWMEYLPASMGDVVENQKNIDVYWSAYCQVFSALCVAQSMYDFIHNDLHCENVRVRKVAEDSVLWYQLDTGEIMCVPTFGYVYVIIDFGRCCISPWKQKNNKNGRSLISYEFSQGGQCSHLIPDNPRIDTVRLCSSLEEHTELMNDTEDPRIVEFRNLMKKICKTTDGTDLFSLWNDPKKRGRLDYYLDDLPRKICRGPEVFEIIREFLPKYQTKNLPKGVEPFKIPTK